MFYLICIGSSATLIIINDSFSVHFSLKSLVNATTSVIVGIMAIFLLDAIVAVFIRRLTPRSWYHPSRALFAVSKKERNIYKALKIKRWKCIVPELGFFTGFSKKELKSIDDREYLTRFLAESNYGVVIHIANALLGFLISFIPTCSEPRIWIPICAVNFFLSILPVFVLRYTSYTLLKLYQRSQRT